MLAMWAANKSGNRDRRRQEGDRGRERYDEEVSKKRMSGRMLMTDGERVTVRKY